MDIKPVVSKHSLMNYLTKYVSKNELQSLSLGQVLRQISAKQDPNDPAGKAFIKLAMKFSGQRDMSAQEVLHYILAWMATIAAGTLLS